MAPRFSHEVCWHWWLSLLYVHYCCPIWAWIHLISHNEWKPWWIGLDVKINLASILYLPVRDYHSIISKQVQSIIFIVVVVSTENIILKTTKDSIASQIDWLRKIMISCLDLMPRFCSLYLICKKFFFLLFCRKYSGKTFLSLSASLPKTMLAHIVQTYSLSVFPMLDDPVPLVQKCWSC